MPEGIHHVVVFWDAQSGGVEESFHGVKIRSLRWMWGGEHLRRPARSWQERSAGVDCDCMSIFASSVLTNLKLELK